MILAVDVHYQDDRGYVAGVAFEYWHDGAAIDEYVTIVEQVNDYEPGQFYRRELPCIEQLLTEHQLQPQLIVVDGYVFLDGYSRPGLGWHLYRALNEQTPIIGVAKTAFAGIPADYEVYRGESARPLYVTAIGIPLDAAQNHIRTMHGPYRMPTLLSRVDRLCREAA